MNSPPLAHAFKEWAVICQCLAAGWQTLILRKGGIAEGPEGFRVEHDRFWLFPTYVHQQAALLAPAALPVLTRVQADRGDAGQVRLQHFCEVADLHQITREAQALSLGGWHFWTDAAIRQRFHYKRPGLYALTVRVYQMPQPVWIPLTPYYEGCKSWVELEQPLPTGGALPAIADDLFAQQREAIRRALEASP